MSERDDHGRIDAEAAFGGGLPGSGADAFGGPLAPAPSSPGGFAPPRTPTPGEVPPPPPGFVAPPPPSASPPRAVGGAAYGPPAHTAGAAIASLILGLIGALLCPFVASIAAIAMWYQAKRAIAADPVTVRGQGIATAGLVLGVIGLVWWTLVFAIGILDN